MTLSQLPCMTMLFDILVMELFSPIAMAVGWLLMQFSVESDPDDDMFEFPALYCGIDTFW